MRLDETYFSLFISVMFAVFFQPDQSNEVKPIGNFHRGSCGEDRSSIRG